MNALLHLAVGNALLATVLALVAGGIGRVCRRPALVHCLWVLVLVKLITPSLVELPIPWPDQPGLTGAQPGLAQAPIVSPEPSIAWPESSQARDVTGDPEEPDGPADVSAVPSFLPEPDGPPSSVERRTLLSMPALEELDTLRAEAAAIPWIPLLGSVWLIGSAAWFFLIACRIYCFHRLLRCARPASARQLEQAQHLAQRLGLAGCPALLFVPGRLSPMVWALGRRPRLFVPSALWERLSEEQQETLLVHELAHLRRRDQWIRILELIVTTLYWWHPVVWWACREIREAEEQCCDAWVVWTLPRAARAYATALLATLDFLSETQGALPALASGIGHVHDLKRRLTMIMHGKTARALSVPGLALVVGLGALWLPLVPTWAQGQREEPAEPRAVEEADEVLNAEATEDARQEVEEMKREVEQVRQEFERAQQRLHAAVERLAKLQAEAQDRRHAGAGRAQDPLLGSPSRDGARDSERRLSELERKLDALLKEVQSLRREMRRPGAGMMPGAPPGATTPAYGLPSRRRPGEGGDRPSTPPRPPAALGPVPPTPALPGVPAFAPPAHPVPGTPALPGGPAAAPKAPAVPALPPGGEAPVPALADDAEFPPGEAPPAVGF